MKIKTLGRIKLQKYFSQLRRKSHGGPPTSLLFMEKLWRPKVWCVNEVINFELIICYYLYNINVIVYVSREKIVE